MYEYIAFPSHVIIIMVTMWLVDRMLIILDGKKSDINQRYYVVHALTNTLNMYLTYPDLIHCLLHPLNVVGFPHDTFPTAICIALHLHHFVIGFNKMNLIDCIHHLVSCFFVSIISTYYFTGPLVNYTIFFICGLPGGIDYYLLTLKKYDIIDSMTEKYYNTILNMWIRLPGMLYTCFLAYINYILNIAPYHPFMIFLIIILNSSNAIFFAERVVQNYGLWEYKTRIETKDMEDSE